MAFVVQEYENLPAHDVEDIERLAKHVVTARQDGHRLIVVTPAPSPSTRSRRAADTLLDDALAALGGEVYTAPPALLAALPAAGGAAPGLPEAARPVREALKRGAIVRTAVPRPDVADPRPGAPPASARSGTTAIGLAAAFEADVCEVYTAAGGIHTADPHIVPHAREVSELGYESARELAACGAGVLAPGDLDTARRFGLTVRLRPLHTAAAYTDPDFAAGTLIRPGIGQPAGERTAFTGIAHDLPGVEVVLTGVSDRPGAVAPLLRELAEAGVGLLMATRARTASAQERPSDMTLVLTGPAALAAVPLLAERCAGTGVRVVSSRGRAGRVSLVGSGLRSGANVPIFSAALARAGVRLDLVCAAETRISALCPAASVPRAVRALHTEFGLDSGPRPEGP